MRKKNSLSAVSPIEVMNNLKSDDETLQLWAIDQLPLQRMIGGQKENADAFEYINAIILSKDDNFHHAVQQAIIRELKKRALTSNDRIRVLLPFLIKMSRSTGVTIWNELLRELCKNFHDPIQQSLAFDQVSPIFLLDHSTFGIACAIYMTTGLCEAGAIMPTDLINNLVQQPIVLQQFLQTFLTSLISTQSEAFVDQILKKIIHSPIAHSVLINAAINLEIIPPILQRQITDTLKAPSHTHDLAAIIAKNCTTIIHKGFAKPKLLLQIVWKAKIFSPKYYDIISNFYMTFIKEMTPKDAVLFYKKIVDSKSPYSIKLSKLVIDVNNTQQCCDIIVPLLCNVESFVRFEEWCDAVAHVINKVNSEYATTLTECIIERCRFEINEGHVASFPLLPPKEIDAMENFQRPSKVPIQICSWRQIAGMLSLLSNSPCAHIVAKNGIELIKLALKKHTFPLIDSIVDILDSIRSHNEEILILYQDIFNGNSYSKLFFLKLLQKSIHLFKEADIKNVIYPMIVQIFNSDQPPNVICTAIKTLSVFLKLGQNSLSLILTKELIDSINELSSYEDKGIIETLKECKKDIEKLVSNYRPPAPKTRKKRSSSIRRGAENMDPNSISNGPSKKQRTSLLNSGSKHKFSIVRPARSISLSKKTANMIQDMNF